MQVVCSFKLWGGGVKFLAEFPSPLSLTLLILYDIYNALSSQISIQTPNSCLNSTIYPFFFDLFHF